MVSTCMQNIYCLSVYSLLLLHPLSLTSLVLFRTCSVWPVKWANVRISDSGRPVKKENRDWLEVFMCFVVSMLRGETNWNGEIRWPSTPTNILNTIVHMDLMIWSEKGATTTHNSTWFGVQRLPSKDENSHCWLIDMSIICSSFCIFPQTFRNECASMTTICVITLKASQDFAVASSSYSCLWTVSVKSLLKANYEYVKYVQWHSTRSVVWNTFLSVSQWYFHLS